MSDYHLNGHSMTQPDFIDRLRHRLIRWLSCGDMILLNFEREEDGRLRARNLGPRLVAGAHFRSGLGIGALRGGPETRDWMVIDGARQSLTITDCLFTGRRR